LTRRHKNLDERDELPERQNLGAFTRAFLPAELLPRREIVDQYLMDIIVHLGRVAVELDAEGGHDSLASGGREQLRVLWPKPSQREQR
jgi:hypothetical protein